jgi:hypothetical protein
MHESPVSRHSVDVAQNWSGARAGHGPARQLVTSSLVAQQTSPLAQSAALVQMALPPDEPAPPLLDPPPASPYDTDPLELPDELPPLLDDPAPPPASSPERDPGAPPSSP